ncbi:MAG: winged helix-turn-helix domain-containing protein, partial [Spirochaetales bacterium]
MPDQSSSRDAQTTRRRVLREIWAQPGTSRVSIAQTLSLNKSTVTKIVTDLLEEEMIQ